MKNRIAKIAQAGAAGLLGAAGALGCAAEGETATGESGQEISPHDRYIITYADGADVATARDAGDVVTELDRQNAVAAEIPEHELAALRNDPAVESIEVDPVREPQAQSVPYGIEMVQADALSDDQAGEKTVCVIDSGYDIEHEDLPDGANVTKSELSGTGDAFEDGCGHGTHVTGTINALNNDLGVVGILPNDEINIHVVKYFNDSCGASFASSLLDAANECVDAGADVINMSLGGGLPNETEEAAFSEMFEEGLLPVAAAGNDGDESYSYPASYDSVVSVAAIDEEKDVAEFSQRNDQVELSAPGVAVSSTVPMESAEVANFDAAGERIDAVGMDGSPLYAGEGPLVDCGLGTSACEAADGGVCLIERGEITFAEKVQNCEAGGGEAAVIYNNESGIVLGTLGDEETSIPSAGIRREDGEALLAEGLEETASLAIEPGNYDLMNGTSMASPHVAGVAALVWSHDPDRGAAEIRDVLAETAEDLGESGRTPEFGYGLVRAEEAVEALGGAE